MDDLLISANQVNGNPQVLRSMTVGLDRVTGFFDRYYFDSYIKEGGSKIRFITGKKGCGKSHLLSLLSYDAADRGYFTVSLDARQVNLFDFKDIFLSVMEHVDTTSLAMKTASAVAGKLGYDWKAEDGSRFQDYLADSRRGDSLVTAEIKTELRRNLLGNSHIDHNMATVFSLLAGMHLGCFELSGDEIALAQRWLSGDTSMKVTQLRSIGLAPYKIDKYNARNMLRSLSELLHLAGYSGMLITFDNVETIVTGKREMGVNYTKKRRDDTYESIRDIVDDIDNFRFTMFIFAFDRILLDDEKNGLKTYQALWLRIQNEIVSTRLNFFQDLLDMDRANEELLTPQAVVEMSKNMARLLSDSSVQARILSEDEAKQLLANAKNGSISVPLMVSRRTLESQEGGNEL